MNEAGVWIKRLLTVKCRGKERNMRRLIIGDFLQIVIEGFVIAGFLEVIQGEVCKSFTVKLVLCRVIALVHD